MRFLRRRGLLLLAAATALALAAPAVASAAVDSLTVSPTSVPAASTSTNLTVDYHFTTAPSSLTTSLPAGLLANGTINGGACLATPESNAPPSACQIGTATANGTPGLTLFLVQGHTGDIAGIEIVAGPAEAGFGDVTSRSTDGGLNIAFASLPPALTSLSTSFTGTDLRMPTNCPGGNFTASTDGQSTPTSATAFSVTGCSGLPYNPGIAATVIKQAGSSQAEVITTTSQQNALVEAATKTLKLGIPSSVTANVTAIGTCFISPCTIGTAKAVSPLLPNAVLASGTVTLGGILTSPTLTISFPAVNLTLTGSFNSTFTAITFSNVPDFPLSSLAVDITGTSMGKAFTTDCSAARATATFTAWSGAVKSPSAPIQYQGCPAVANRPSASGSLSGLGTGHPKLKLKVKHGSNGPNISSVSVKPASGLKFKCVKSGKSCKGLSVSGATVKSAKVSGGQLVIKFKHAASSVTVKAKGPALRESSSLVTKVKKHKVKSLAFTVKAKDSSGTSTTIKLKLKA